VVPWAGDRFDWRDADVYAPLLAADRCFFAWEWLRRDPAYRAATQALSAKAMGSAGVDQPQRFGLVAFEPPQLRVPQARPLWCSKAHPLVLQAGAHPIGTPADLFDLDRTRHVTRLTGTRGGEHLLLSDGLRSIRLDAPQGTFRRGPVSLHYSIAGLASADPPVLTLRRFLAFCRNGRFSRSLHPPETRARRWILILRTWDALSAGAEQREIASVLLSRCAGKPRWRIQESSVRSQVQRLVRSARQFAGGRYRSLLL
jgi:hypothetical protein